MTTRLLPCTLAGATFFAAASAVSAQDATPPTLALELNSLQPSEKGCGLTFVITSNLGADLANAAFGVALFSDAGVVGRPTVLDFNELPAGKTKVARFDLEGAECAKVSRVRINHATECVGTGIDPDACQRQLKPGTRSDITFGM